ncbi:MAG: ATP:cob(I)alamin adenosyltransferase, partial [bacterium]|nr:ATP:cob(I)alamin adenosyltransferase [Candidatus Methylomirabilis sp.]
FILPGGSEGGALLHLARTVCRRAERRMVALSQYEPLAPVLIAYINRLSDLLFTLARAVNREAGIEEIPW